MPVYNTFIMSSTLAFTEMTHLFRESIRKSCIAWSENLNMSTKNIKGGRSHWNVTERIQEIL